MCRKFHLPVFFLITGLSVLKFWKKNRKKVTKNRKNCIQYICNFSYDNCIWEDFQCLNFPRINFSLLWHRTIVQNFKTNLFFLKLRDMWRGQSYSEKIWQWIIFNNQNHQNFPSIYHYMHMISEKNQISNNTSEKPYFVY